MYNSNMERNILEIVPVLTKLTPVRQKEIEDYFKGAPNWLLETIKVVTFEKEFTFIHENEPVEYIYVIVNGTARAIDYRVYGVVYDFMKVDVLQAMGGMEAVLDLPEYRASIQTVTPCTALKIPFDIFYKWLETDVAVLKREAKTVCQYLHESDRKGRLYIFLQGSDRFGLYLLDIYKKNAYKGVCIYANSRQELADHTGLSVRTINRAIKKFYENGWISKQGNKFSMNQKQYNLLNEEMSNLIER